MANTNITLENLLELAQAATSIGDGDYIFIYKAGANGFSKIEKNVFFQGIAASAGGGMSDEVYAAIQNNVEALRSILYALTKTWLANLAFTDGRPSDTLLASIASQFTWPDNDSSSGGGDTPTGDPSLTVYVDGVAVANGGTINVGTKTSSSGSVSKTITIKGSNLSSAVSLSMGASTSGLSVSPTSIDASQVTASSGATATISYSGNIASASGSLTISSGTASVTLGLTASYQEQGGGETSYQVSAGTLSNVQITETLPATVSSGGSFMGHLVADRGYSLPSSIAVSGTHGTVSYDQSSGVFTISNITSNVAISATAVAPVSIELVQGKYIAYQGTSPRTPSNASLYTDICCMTAVLSVDFSDIDETVWETAYIEWVHGGIASKGNISFTKNNGTTAESVQGASSEKDTYSVDNMTSQTLSYWKQRRTLVNGLIATFKYDTSTNKVASGCCVVLKDANGNILKTLISANDLQDATFVTE